MNFIETFKEGQLGKNIGLPTGIPPLTEAIRGIRRKTTYGVAASQKVGKTTLVDFSFVIHPYLHMEKEGKLDDIEWIYFSYEIDRVSKEYKYAAFFMAHDHGVYNFYYKDKLYLMDSDYLMGALVHRNPDNTFEMIPVQEDHKLLLRTVYKERIIPLFGEFSASGQQITPGKITFIEKSENPTGVNKFLWDHAKKNGEVIYQSYSVEGKILQREIGYKPNNPDKMTMVITDHIRKHQEERGFDKKRTIDKFLEYCTILRNICYFTFVQVAHMNRGISNIERLKFAGEYIYPTADDIKDSGNLGEECNVLLTMFNPSDEKYNLKSHFGVELENCPLYRSIHVAEFRGGTAPVHIQTNMIGGINMFTPLNQF